MQTVIIVIHLMIVLTMCGLVLLQKSEGGGLGLGGGGGGFMSSRGTTNVLTRATAFLAAAFFATSLFLSVLAGMHRNPSSIVTPGRSGPAAPTAPGAPVPLTLPGGSGGILDQQRPAAPEAPRSK